MSEGKIKCAHLEPNTAYLMVDGEMIKLADMKEALALLRECLPWLEMAWTLAHNYEKAKEATDLISRVRKAVG